MRSKVTVVLLFLNVILFFYIFQYEEKWRAEQKTFEARRRVLGPEAASIDAITRTSRAGPPIRLERRGDAWWLTRPYVWPADPNAVARIINELQFLEHETSFAVADLAKSGQTLADYGLADPALTLTFTSAGKTYPLRIGDDTKIGNRLYVLSPDGTHIHVVGRSLADSVGLPLDELRSKSIFTIPVFEVRSLNVQTAAPTNIKVRLRRDAAARWSFEAPILARASKTNVEVVINTLNGLTAKNFPELRDTDLERTGLNSPLLRVTLEGNARRETLLLGRPVAAGPAPAPDAAGAETEYYAKIEDKAVIFTVVVPLPLLEVLRTAQESLRDPRVLEFDPATVTALTLTAPNQPELTLQRLEAGAAGTGPAWQVVTHIDGQAPLTIAADTALVDALLQQIYLLSAKEFLSDAPSAADLEDEGFNRPERELTLSLSSGGGPRGTEASTLTLQIGVSPGQPGKAYARVTNAPYVYRILPDILEATPSAARHYRQRLLRELPEGATITGLVLTDLANHAPLVSLQSGPDKTMAAVIAAEPEPRHKALAGLLAQLQVLRARRFTAESFTPDHADTAQGPRPWLYRLDLTLHFPGGNAAAPGAASTLYLTGRLGGTTMLAGTTEFGGVVFEVQQELLDAVFALTYAEKNDPGLPAAAPETQAAPPPAETRAEPNPAPAAPTVKP